MTHQSIRVLVALGMAAATASSLTGQQVAQKNNCPACHAVADRVVGPAYKDVAAKYKDKGRKDAEATLIANIKTGGSGKWGLVPMPPQTTLSDARAKTLAKRIPSQGG